MPCDGVERADSVISSGLSMLVAVCLTCEGVSKLWEGRRELYKTKQTQNSPSRLLIIETVSRREEGYELPCLLRCDVNGRKRSETLDAKMEDGGKKRKEKNARKK